MMRKYGNVAPTFWTGETGRALVARGSEAVVASLYLMTAPGSNMLGLYYQPLLFMAHETGLGVEGATKGLQACIDVNFCLHDSRGHFVWVVEMARFQISEQLEPKDLRCKGIQNAYDELPDNPFLGLFFDQYARAFHLTRRRQPKFPWGGETDLFGHPKGTPPEAPSKPGSGAGTGSEAGPGPGSGTGPGRTPLTPGGSEAPAPSQAPKPATRSARAPKSTAAKSDPPTGASTWNAYSTAYGDRYGAPPVRNAKVNAQIAQLVDRLGSDEAPRVAAWFVAHNRQDYVRATHTVDLLLRDAEGLRTQWANGRQTTNAQAQQADRTQTNANAFVGLLAEAEARETQEPS